MSRRGSDAHGGAGFSDPRGTVETRRSREAAAEQTSTIHEARRHAAAVEPEEDDMDEIIRAVTSHHVTEYDARRNAQLSSANARKREEELKLWKERLEENARNRESRLKGILSATFGETGIFSLLELDESASPEARLERLALMSSLLEIVDMDLIKNPAQSRVQILDRYGREVKERDKLLGALIEVIAGDKMTPDEKDAVYNSFYYLIHQVALDKEYIPAADSPATRISRNVMLCGHGSEPRYFNDTVSNRAGKIFPTVNPEALVEETENGVEYALVEEKSRLNRKFREVGGAPVDFIKFKTLGTVLPFEKVKEVASSAALDPAKSEKNIHDILAEIIRPSPHPAAAAGSRSFMERFFGR